MRLRAFHPYDQILCILKHVKDVKDRSNTPKSCNAMYVEDVKDSCCMLHVLCRIMSKMSKILKEAITDFYFILFIISDFISLLSEMLKMCTNYNVDSNTKSLNYSKIRFKPLIYFELQQSLN